MKTIWRYMKLRLGRIGLSVSVKLLASVLELLIPYILEHIIDRVVPGGRAGPVVGWGALMVVVALLVRQTNIFANMTAVSVSRDCIERLRQDLFVRTARLSGSQTDAFTLPSLISRMTSDSYNVQNFITATQTIGIRAPILLVGGIALTLTMDPVLASILCVMAPVLLCVVVFVSRKGVPLYDKVQQQMDAIVRVMRENITGIRVVKALSKTDYEKRRFRQTNDDLTRSDLKASIIMAIPGPSVQLCLNIGLVLVVILGAHRVNAGQSDPGVILAFLTYFTIILNSVMGLNRIFMLLSKASASADRIGRVLETGDDQPVEPLTEARRSSSGAFLEFDHVSFTHLSTAPEAEAASFAGGQRAKCLDDVSFTLDRGETLGIIGATGSGKSTIINLLMRFYDAQEGTVYVDGRDVRTYGKQELRRRFGMVFQNDSIFAESLADNISLGRGLSREDIQRAAEDAMAAPFIEEKPGTYDYVADIKGANLSGGQKQRVLISRALAARPEILILDDATSALDYATDARLRQSLRTRYAGTTSVIVAQRVSSLISADKILVLDEGRVLDCGSHDELLERCEAYRDIYHSQMGELA
ncbi:MAG: ABC transporter ATP-binding protein [Oscillospiraceae bacterium]|nr:ABC transporter ATP-binding protein [Oscillospiraceae bacterium]